MKRKDLKEITKNQQGLIMSLNEIKNELTALGQTDLVEDIEETVPEATSAEDIQDDDLIQELFKKMGVESSIKDVVDGVSIQINNDDIKKIAEHLGYKEVARFIPGSRTWRKP